MINVETVLDIECLKAISAAAAKTKNARTWRRIFFAFFLILGLFYLYLAINPNIEGDTVGCVFMSVLFLFLAFFGRKALLALGRRRFLHKNPEAKIGKYSFSEEGVIITNPTCESKHKWEAFDSHGTESHYLWLRRKDDKAYVMIDKNKISPEETAQLEEWFNAVKG